MLDQVKFNKLKSKYGAYSSFAIWANASPSSKRKSDGIDDLSIFNNCLHQLKTEYVFVSLNPAAHTAKANLNKDWHAFHSGYRWSKDYILRDLFKGSNAYGSYLTDLYLENNDNSPLIETDSNKVIKNSNHQLLNKNLSILNEQLNIIADDTTIVAFGDYAYNVLNKWFIEGKLSTNVKAIKKITHFSAYNKTFADKKAEFISLVSTN